MMAATQLYLIGGFMIGLALGLLNGPRYWLHEKGPEWCIVGQRLKYGNQVFYCVERNTWKVMEEKGVSHAPSQPYR